MSRAQRLDRPTLAEGAASPRVSVIRSVVRRGLAAGAAGTAVETLWSHRVRHLTGTEPPVYAPDAVASSLLRSMLGREVSHRTGVVCGTALRVTYGPAWGVALAVNRSWRSVPALRSIVAVGLLIWSVELVCLPSIGATPPLRQWPRAQIALDAVNGLFFSFAGVGVLRLLERLAEGHTSGIVPLHGGTSMKPEIETRVRDRAYQIWEEKGCPTGRELDHWRQAAAELAAEEASLTGKPAVRSARAQRPRESASTATNLGPSV